MSATLPATKPDEGWLSFRGRMPAAMLLGLVAQIGVGVWQVGQISATLGEHERRLTNLEASRQAQAHEQALRNENLAGVLADLKATVQGLADVVRRLDRSGPR